MYNMLVNKGNYDSKLQYTKVTTSLAKSLARSVVTKHDMPSRAKPASYMLVEFKS